MESENKLAAAHPPRAGQNHRYPRSEAPENLSRDLARPTQRWAVTIDLDRGIRSVFLDRTDRVSRSHTRHTRYVPVLSWCSVSRIWTIIIFRHSTYSILSHILHGPRDHRKIPTTVGRSHSASSTINNNSNINRREMRRRQGRGNQQR